MAPRQSLALAYEASTPSFLTFHLHVPVHLAIEESSLPKTDLGSLGYFLVLRKRRYKKGRGRVGRGGGRRKEIMLNECYKSFKYSYIKNSSIYIEIDHCIFVTSVFTR